MIERGKKVDVAVFHKPKEGNVQSGDSHFYLETEDNFLVSIADGLGSGQIAKESSQAVIDVIRKNYNLPLDELMMHCNDVFFGNDLRGCVLGILRLDFQEMKYSYVSVGNISIVIMTPEDVKKRNIPLQGYLSGIPRKIKVHEGTLEKDMLFFMFSDGVNERQLTTEFYNLPSVADTVDWFTDRQVDYMEDDTTLVAMKYTD